MTSMPTPLSGEAVEKTKNSNGILLTGYLREAGTLIGLIALMVFFASQSPIFLTERNLINVLQQSSINACIALGMTLVIISGGIDLSVGAVAAFTAVITADLMLKGTPIPLAILAGVALGIGCGIVNGLLISRARLQPFIATLGTMSVYRALALIYTGGNPILSVPADYRSFFTSTVGPLPMSVVIVIVMAFIGWILLRRTALGEYILSVGGNEEAASICGVPVTLTRLAVYGISGFLAALAAFILVGRLGAAEPILGQNWELDAIASAAIGGASLMGGKGSIVGTLMGAVILGAMRNGLTLMNVQAFYQLLATGVIILLAMLVDRLTRGNG